MIAEGIETEDDLVAAHELGAHWGQGWLFGRPGRIDEVSRRYAPEAASVLRAPRPGFHQQPGTPFQAAASRGPVATVTADSIARELAELRRVLAGDDSAVVVVSGREGEIPGIAGLLGDLIGLGRSVIVVDKPVAGEFAAVVIGAGYGRGLCVRSSNELEICVLDDPSTVAAVARALLNRHG